VPPCFDVYVWIRAAHRVSALAAFVHRYVDTDNPGDPRFGALVRTLMEERPADGDGDALASLHRDGDASSAYSLYLRARTHHGAIVTLTDEGDLVLGVSIDDPLGDPRITIQASDLIATLLRELQAVAGVAGVELAPPQSASEWCDDGLTILREGHL